MWFHPTLIRKKTKLNERNGEREREGVPFLVRAKR